MPAVWPAWLRRVAFGWRSRTLRELPADQPGKASELLIRIVQYAGSSNGAITIDVKNPTDRPQEFSAKGLYFVPQGNANEAPQRLGAVGPFQVHGAGKPERREHLTIGPGETERLTLDVYCIDSHRSSPVRRRRSRREGSGAREALAGDRRQRAGVAAPLGGVSPRREAVIQSRVWKNRDANWIPLDGEGKQEAAKKR
jgi:hypothetical protein